MEEKCRIIIVRHFSFLKGEKLMKDYMKKVLAFDGQVKASAIIATEAIKEAQQRHDTWSAATAALGRAMIGTQLLASSLKNDDRLSVQINGDGLGGKIFAEANGNGDMRGYITNPHVSLPLNAHGKLDVRSVVGTKGTLTVIKDLGMKEPFSGQIELVDGELGVDFTYYLAVSEQINGAVGVSVLVNPDETVRAAGGFMIQLLPGATEETIEEIERRITNVPLISKLIDQQEDAETLLNRLLGEENIQPLEELPVRFWCPCNREKFTKGLISLGKAELLSIIEEEGEAEVVCHFCNEAYHYKKDELESLVLEIENQQAKRREQNV